MRLGIEKAAMIRVRAGISYALTEAMDEGHCGLPTEELIPLAEKLLEVPTGNHSAPRSISNCKKARWLPTGLAKRHVYFWLVCIAPSAPSLSG